MKTNFQIRVTSLKNYHEIASELIMMGYADDIQWNQQLADDIEDIEKDHVFSVHVHGSEEFSLFNFDDRRLEHFDTLEDFMNSTSVSELQKQIRENRRQSEELKSQLIDLKEERLKECTFKVGELVDVYYYSRFDKKATDYLGQGSIAKILVDDTGRFDYKLNKIKKDGSVSMQCFDTYCSYEVKKIIF